MENINHRSLVNLLRSEDRNIENIWQIHEAQDHIVFRSYKMLIAVSNNKAVTASFFQHAQLYQRLISDRLYVADTDGLKAVDLSSLELTLLAKISELHDEEVISILPGFRAQELLVITKPGSLFIFRCHAKEIALLEKDLSTGVKKSYHLCHPRVNGRTIISEPLASKVISLDANRKANQQRGVSQSSGQHRTQSF